MVKQEPSFMYELSLAAQENSQRWFGDTSAATSLAHHVLALCGEAGSLANIIKVIDRGDLDPNDAHAHFDLVMKLADILVYLLNIGALLHCDLLRAYEHTIAENERRFVQGRIDREKQHKKVGWHQYG